MRECSKCNEVKQFSEFSKQKKKPAFYYAWCDLCRESANADKTFNRAKSYRAEVTEMRDKARELRKLNDNQVSEIKKRKSDGEHVKVLASEFNVSDTTIYKALHGYKV